MSVMIELPEMVIVRAAIVASGYPEMSLTSVIEECFNYGVRSLYGDITPPLGQPMMERLQTGKERDRIDSITSSVSTLSGRYTDGGSDTVCYSEEEIPDSLGNPVINKDGIFEI